MRTDIIAGLFDTFGIQVTLNKVDKNINKRKNEEDYCVSNFIDLLRATSHIS